MKNFKSLSIAIHAGLVASVTISLASPVKAQEQQGEEEGATTLDRIQVTGSRIKRVDAETSQPVFTLNTEEIRAQGLTSIGDVIQNISTNGSALNSTFNNGGNGETQVDLRNIGSNRTLVLVNGRRWVGGTGLGGAVDLNTIPTSAVERIEVLKDGASVIYGSDAIAGVINIILRTDFDGAEASAFYGQFDKGDGTRQAFDFTVGSVGDKWSALVGIGYVEEQPVFAGDRPISAVPNFGATAGFGNSGTPPTGRFSINGLRPDGTTGQFIPDLTQGPAGFRPYVGATDSYNFAPDNYLLTPQERTSLFTQGSLQITDNLRFETTITYNERKSEQLLAANPIVLGVINPGTNGEDIVISADNIYNPYGADITGIQYRPNEVGGRSFNQNVDTFAFSGAFKGSFDLGEKFFDWEAGYFYGNNDQNDSTEGLYNISALRQALGPSFIDPVTGAPTCGTVDAPIARCVPLNILTGGGSVTPEMAAFVGFNAKDKFGYEQKSLYASVGGGLFDIQGGEVAFSFGLETRDESGFDSPDALINLGDTTGNARTATAGDYSVDEAYLEFSIPLLADLPAAKLLEVNIASRYSDYSNFGDTTNSKAGLKWKPIDDLLIRGNWSEGFRAPSIAELFTGVSDSFPEVTDPCNGSLQGDPNINRPASCAGIPAYDQQNTQLRTLVGGNVNLGPENSVSKTFGVVYSPGYVEGLGIAVDWWQIEIENAIFTQSAQSILNSCHFNNSAAACALISRAADGQISRLLATPANIGTTLNEGVDLNVSYALPEFSWGKLNIVWDSTYFIESSDDVNGDGVVSEDPVIGESGNQIGEYSSRDNNWRIRSNLALRWEYGDFGATWNSRFYSNQEESCDAIAGAQIVNLCSDPTRITNLDGDDAGTEPDGPVARPQNRIPSVTFTDLSIFWSSPWDAKITFGVNNAFDRDPPRSATVAANSFDPQYEVPGRFYYMRYNQRF